MRIILMLVLSLTTLTAQSQGRTHDEILEDFLKQRKAMMQQMMEAFDDDSFFKDDFFSDDFKGMRGFKGAGNNIDIEEKQLSSGNIEIIVTPKKENINMDIQTNDNYITIKTQTRVEEKTDQDGNTFSSSSMSSSSRSIAIPDGYKAKSPEAAGKSLKITLVPSKKIKKIILPDSNGRVPIQKKSGEETI